MESTTSVEVSLASNEETKPSKSIIGEIINQKDKHDDIDAISSAARNPLQIIPLEMWEMVFGNLTSSIDLLSCANGNPEWKDFLRVNHSWIPLAEVLPFVLPYLDASNQLNCRLICKSLTEVVDNDLIRQQEDSSPILKTKLVNTTSFHSRILNDLLNSTKFGFWNPSLWKSITVQGIFPGTPLWRLRILSCLVKQGKHVEECELSMFTEDDFDPTKMLYELLTYMPNLRKLKIVGEQGSHQCHHKVIWLPKPKQSEFNRLRLKTEKNIKLPTMKHLKKVDLIKVDLLLAKKIVEKYGAQAKCSSVK